MIVQIGVDIVLHVMMETWMEQREADREKVIRVFRQALPAKGCCTQDDFKSLMRCMNLELSSMLPDRIVTEMFREALQLSEKGQKITADAFFQVCAMSIQAADSSTCAQSSCRCMLKNKRHLKM
jgi:hypothetical protein